MFVQAFLESHLERRRMTLEIAIKWSLDMISCLAMSAGEAKHHQFSRPESVVVGKLRCWLRFHKSKWFHRKPRSRKKSTDFVYVNRNSSVMACYPYSRHARREKWWVVCMWKKNRKDENDSCGECEIFTFPEKFMKSVQGLPPKRQKSCISSRESKHKRCGHARRSNLNVMRSEMFTKEINWMKMGKSWWWKTCLPKLLLWWPTLQQKSWRHASQ